MSITCITPRRAGCGRSLTETTAAYGISKEAPFRPCPRRGKRIVRLARRQRSVSSIRKTFCHCHLKTRYGPSHTETPKGPKLRSGCSLSIALTSPTLLSGRKSSKADHTRRSGREKRRANGAREKKGCPARIRTSANWSRANRAAVTPPGKESESAGKARHDPAQTKRLEVYHHGRDVAQLVTAAADDERLALALPLLDPGPGVLQRYRAVEDGNTGARILRVGVEIAEPLELMRRAG